MEWTVQSQRNWMSREITPHHRQLHWWLARASPCDSQVAREHNRRGTLQQVSGKRFLVALLEVFKVNFSSGHVLSHICHPHRGRAQLLDKDPMIPQMHSGVAMSPTLICNGPLLYQQHCGSPWKSTMMRRSIGH